MAEITHRFVQSNGIRMRIAEAGKGPLVVLCHGFPESWYSWRHQIPALADAGYHVVAPDQRGYGGTDAPPNVESYTLSTPNRSASIAANLSSADRGQRAMTRRGGYMGRWPTMAITSLFALPR